MSNIIAHGKRMVPEYLIKKLLNGGYSAKLKDITNIQSLTDEQINELKAGDIVLKKTGDQTHTYIVTYKEEGHGICLTYADATYLETISYDYVEGHWVYNSTDVNHINLMEDIVDHSGNKRFIEGNGVPSVTSGVTLSYYKWSLSGTHLMLVAAGTIENGTVLATNSLRISFDVPKWVLDKVMPVWENSRIELKNISGIGSDWTVQQIPVVLTKTSNNNLEIGNTVSVTLTAERSFRVQFDLLIDND